MDCMGFRRHGFVLLGLVGSVAVAVPAGIPGAGFAPGSAGIRWRTVTFRGVSLRVPARWPVIDLSRHPRACPRLDVHAVYLGAPGPDPACPARLVGRTEAVVLGPLRPGSPDARLARAPLARAVIRADAGLRGQAVLTNADQAVSRDIVDALPGAGVEVSISFRADRALAREIQASLTVRRPPGAADRRGRGARARRAAGERRPAIRHAARPAGARGPARHGTSRGAARRAVRHAAAGVDARPGFDTCAAPSAAAMTSWLASSYRAVGVYIGGVNRACAQPNLTASWLAGITRQGWRYFPIYVGLQSSCVEGAGDAVITTSQAAAEGAAAASDAIAQATSLGIPRGTPLIDDMEAYGPACDSQVTTFLSAWDATLHARGWTAGVYESFTNIGALVAAAGRITEPDVIYYADWDGQPTTTSPYMPAAMWANHQRIHQYLGGHVESHGGVAIDIDSDQLDVRLSGAPPPPPPPAGHSGFRVSVAINANGTAEWFARTAAGQLAHAWQQPVGSLTWSRMRTVGDSPAGLASNPAAVAQANGVLTVFARDAQGRIAHAWQQAGFPNDWEWGTPLSAPRAPARAGTDPAAVLLPSGDVEIYQTAATGAVLTRRQLRPGDNRHWTAWGDIGGHCASTPVPLTDPAGGVDVFCVTTSGGAAADSWNGTRWSGWASVGNGPSDLTGTPAAVVNGAGQAELFAATSGGGMAGAWQAAPGALAASGSWSWYPPLAGPGSAAGPLVIAGSPSAATWPAGQVIVYAAARNGPPYCLRQLGAAGGAPWGAWSPIPGTAGGAVNGSPTGWLNTTGAAGIVALDGHLQIATASNDGSGWSGWTEAGGGF